MKIKNFVLVLLFLSPAGSLLAQNGTAQQRVIFQGTTDTTYNGAVLILYNKITGDHDSAIAANGQFKISVPYKEPSRYMFYSKYELKKKRRVLSVRHHNYKSGNG